MGSRTSSRRFPGRTTSVASSTWTTQRPSPQLPRLLCASRRATHLWPLRPPPEPTPPLSVCGEQLGNWISHYPPIHPYFFFFFFFFFDMAHKKQCVKEHATLHSSARAHARDTGGGDPHSGTQVSEASGRSSLNEWSLSGGLERQLGRGAQQDARAAVLLDGRLRRLGEGMRLDGETLDGETARGGHNLLELELVLGRSFALDQRRVVNRAALGLGVEHRELHEAVDLLRVAGAHRLADPLGQAAVQ